MRFWNPVGLEASTLKVTVSLGTGGGGGIWSSVAPGASSFLPGVEDSALPGVDGDEVGAEPTSFFGVKKSSFLGVASVKN